MADNLPPSCAVVTKTGSLNFLEPSGPVQGCNGTTLPLFVIPVDFVLNFFQYTWMCVCVSSPRMFLYLLRHTSKMKRLSLHVPIHSSSLLYSLRIHPTSRISSRRLGRKDLCGPYVGLLTRIQNPKKHIWVLALLVLCEEICSGSGYFPFLLSLM